MGGSYLTSEIQKIEERTIIWEKNGQKPEGLKDILDYIKENINKTEHRINDLIDELEGANGIRTILFNRFVELAMRELNYYDIIRRNSDMSSKDK